MALSFEHNLIPSEAHLVRAAEKELWAGGRWLELMQPLGLGAVHMGCYFTSSLFSLFIDFYGMSFS